MKWAYADRLTLSKEEMILKIFPDSCSHFIILICFMGIISLLELSALAIPIEDKNAGLPKPGELVLTSQKDIPRHIWTAERYLEVGRFKDAVYLSRQVLSLQHADIKARACLAAAYKGMGNDKAFNKEAALVRKQAQGSPVLFMDLARTSIATKNFNEAEQYYKKGMKTAADKTELRMGLAKLYVNQRKLKEASNQYAEVLSTKNLSDKHFLNASFALCRIDLEKKDYDKVIPRAKAVTDIYPALPNGYRFLANAYLGKGDNDEAIKVYKKLMAANPKSPVSYQELALIYCDEFKDYDNALRFAKDAVQRFREDAKSQDVAGWVNYSMGRYGEALSGFQAAVRLAPQTPRYYYHLGLACQKMGKRIKAKKAFEQALAFLGPNAPKGFKTELRNRIKSFAL